MRDAEAPAPSLSRANVAGKEGITPAGPDQHPRQFPPLADTPASHLRNALQIIELAEIGGTEYLDLSGGRLVDLRHRITAAIAQLAGAEYEEITNLRQSRNDAWDQLYSTNEAYNELLGRVDELIAWAEVPVKAPEQASSIPVRLLPRAPAELRPKLVGTSALGLNPKTGHECLQLMLVAPPLAPGGHDYLVAMQSVGAELLKAIVQDRVDVLDEDAAQVRRVQSVLESTGDALRQDLEEMNETNRQLRAAEDEWAGEFVRDEEPHEGFPPGSIGTDDRES